MNRIVSLLFLTLLTLRGWSQTADAFKGVWPVTDKAMMKSLNDTWQLKVNGKEGDIPVPGCWETYGFCKPKYDYPDSLTGDYRTTFTVPAAWKGQQVYIRFDGVLRGYDLSLNGQHVGTESIDEARALISSTNSDSSFEYQDLYLALRTLPPKERSAITLFYLNGYNIKEIAVITETSEDAVKKQLSRGRDKLKEKLKL